MKLFESEDLEAYAKLAVEVGLNVREGQRVLLTAPLEAASLVRFVAAEAYRIGARLVDVMWDDEGLDLVRFQHAPRDSFDEFATWRSDALVHAAERGDAVLRIIGRDPDLLRDQDPTLVALAQTTAMKHLKPFADLIMRSSFNWSIISVPTRSWADRVFPELEESDRVQALWEAIRRTVRLDQPDPVAAWRSHLAVLKSKSVALTDKQYTRLEYRAPGTQLTIGLPDGHIWASGASRCSNGIECVPNMPTEEVCTLPHADRVDGTVSSSRPLSCGGMLITDFGFRFEAGRVVEMWAAHGKETLEKVIKTDEGAGRLGEVALVPNSSPISRSELTFFNTLFDENAACHLALGKAIRFCMEGASQMSDEQFQAAGGNESLIHVDFMIGSDGLDVDGVTPTGQTEPVMRGGEWAF